MVGVIVLNYNNWDDTITCIKSLKKSNVKIDYKIYLVDNASQIPIPNKYENYIRNSSNIIFIQSELNKGYAAGNNIGIEKALKDNCDAILIANNDIIFHKNSVDSLYAFLCKNVDYGIVGPKILKLDGNIQMSNMCIKTGIKEKYLVRTKLSKFNKRLTTKYYGLDRNMNESFDVHAVSGCCFMVSKKCAEDIFPMDENTFLFEEELIIGIRMNKLGYKTRYYPDSVITHAHGQSTKQAAGFAYICLIESEIYYCKKYLNASIFKIMPLYILRTIHWCYDSIKYKDFRKRFMDYFIITMPSLFKKYDPYIGEINE